MNKIVNIGHNQVESLQFNNISNVGRVPVNFGYTPSVTDPDAILCSARGVKLIGNTNLSQSPEIALACTIAYTDNQVNLSTF